MALKFNMQPAAAAAATAANETDAKERPTAQHWANIGRVMLTGGEKGAIDVTFIGLPYGIPIDTMNPLKGFGQITQAKNALLQEMQDALTEFTPGQELIIGLPDVSEAQLKPGQIAMLDGLFIQVRCAHTEESRKEVGDNPLLKAMGANKLSFKVAA